VKSEFRKVFKATDDEAFQVFDDENAALGSFNGKPQIP
jgi:hypothetical protein